MQYSNFHTHTTFSDGKQGIRENIESAISKSMLSIGFSDHSYTDFDLSYCIKKENIPQYIHEVRTLKEEYSDRIQVYLGLELDGFSSFSDRELYDYVIGDCHYVFADGAYHSIDHCEEGFRRIGENYFGGDYIAFAEKYYETYARRIELMRPDILGHFDLVTKFGYIDGENPRYRKAALEALDASLAVCPIVEMNTGAIVRKLRKEPYPASFLLKEIKEKDGKIILSSDCHSAENLICYFDDCLEILKLHGFDSVVTLSENKFCEIGIK